ncbi:MAG TPA: hypothetical protein VLE89_00365, partial [Chlamydiales bacterium]|nr:hypothetical protein [Chlamydiales bacterium]
MAAEVKECSICRDLLNEDAAAHAAHLGAADRHDFHLECITPWIAHIRASDPYKSVSCPLCRRTIISINDVQVDNPLLNPGAAVGQAQEVLHAMAVARTREVLDAATHGNHEVVAALLASGPIPIAAGGLAVLTATINGHLAVVVALRNVPIPVEDRGIAVIDAAGKGRKDMIDILLGAGAVISEADRGSAVKAAANFSYQTTVEALLANGPIPREDRGTAVAYAVTDNNLS